MSGIFRFLTGTPTADIVTTIDGGGTINGIAMKFTGLPDESQAINFQRFENDMLKPFGGSVAASGLTLSYTAPTIPIPTGTITASMTINGGIWDLTKTSYVAQMCQYANTQVINKATAVEAIMNSIYNYGITPPITNSRMTPAAPFITTNLTTGDLILNYNTFDGVTIVGGSNILSYTTLNFQYFIWKVLNLNIVNSINYSYTISGTTFSVQIVGSATSDTLAQQALQISAATSQGNIMSFYHGILGGLQTLA